MKLTELLKTIAPSTKIFVYDQKVGKFVGGATAISLLSLMEKEKTEGVIEYMTVGKGKVNLHLQKLA